MQPVIGRFRFVPNVSVRHVFIEDIVNNLEGRTHGQAILTERIGNLNRGPAIIRRKTAGRGIEGGGLSLDDREIGLLEHQIEGCEKLLDEVVLQFYDWMKNEDTPDNAERWFGYTNKDMLNEFKEQYED